MDDPELAKAIEYAQKLLDAAVDVVCVAPEYVELNENWAQDPKVVGLTILCRSISNFRAALLLVQDEHQKLEARVLVRLRKSAVAGRTEGTGGLISCRTCEKTRPSIGKRSPN